MLVWKKEQLEEQNQQIFNKQMSLIKIDKMSRLNERERERGVAKDVSK